MLETHSRKNLSIFLVENDTIDYEWFKALLDRIQYEIFDLSWTQGPAKAVEPQPNGKIRFNLFFPATTVNAVPNQKRVL